MNDTKPSKGGPQDPDEPIGAAASDAELVEQSVDDSTAAAEALEEEPLADDAPLDETPSVPTPSEQVPDEAVWVEETAAGEAPVEVETVDQNPQNPVDENPVAENPVDQNPVEELPPPDEPDDDEEPELRSEANEPGPLGSVRVPGLDEEDGPIEEVPPRLDREQLKAIVEALIFASPEPLTPKLLLKLLSDEPKEDVMAAVEAVQQDYAGRPGLHVAEVAGGFQITTRPELHEWVRRLFHERTTQKLSVAALETLSVVAYKQPITQAEIGEIRGVNTSGVLSTLLERHLVKIVGRKNVVGRPFLYGTTKEFLIRFGLKDLGDLPKIEDMAQQLGFEPPSVLMERPVTDEMLPLDEGEDGGASKEQA